MAFSCFVDYLFWSGRMRRRGFTPWEIPQKSQNKLLPMPGHAHDDVWGPAWQWSNENRGPSSFKNYIHHVALPLLIFELLTCNERSYIEWMYLVAWLGRPKVVCVIFCKGILAAIFMLLRCNNLMKWNEWPRPRIPFWRQYHLVDTHKKTWDDMGLSSTCIHWVVPLPSNSCKWGSVWIPEPKEMQKSNNPSGDY